MGRGYQGAVLNLLRAPEFDLDITEVSEVGQYTRLRVRNEELLGHGRVRDLPPTTWVRLWVPEAGREHQRAYSLAEVDRDRGEATIYVLHHTPDGPASRWALSVAPGGFVSAQLYGGTKYRAPDPGSSMLLVGDPTSAPAIGEALSAAPASCRIHVVLRAQEEMWLPMDSAATPVTRVPPGADIGELVEAVTDACPQGTPDWAWVALEGADTRAVRRHLQHAGLPRNALQHQAYWVRGRAMGISEDSAG